MIRQIHKCPTAKYIVHLKCTLSVGVGLSVRVRLFVCLSDGPVYISKTKNFSVQTSDIIQVTWFLGMKGQMLGLRRRRRFRIDSEVRCEGAHPLS